MFREFFTDARNAASRLRNLQEQEQAARERLERPKSNRWDAHVSGTPTDATTAIDAFLDKRRDARQERELQAIQDVLTCACDAADYVFETLGVVYADALEIRYLEGLTWDETAARLGYASKTTAKSITSVALDWLNSNAIVDRDPDGTPHFHVLRQTEAVEAS